MYNEIIIAFNSEEKKKSIQNALVTEAKYAYLSKFEVKLCFLYGKLTYNFTCVYCCL